MCGIFGVIVAQDSNYSTTFLKKSLKVVAKLSERRGKDSSGLCTINNETIEIIKASDRISVLLKDKSAVSLIESTFSNNSCFKAAFGHSRLVTNGSQLNHGNNQPVVKDGVVGVHNGIVCNADELWEQNSDLKRDYEIDTEVLISLIRKHLTNENSTEQAVSNAISQVFGTVSTALTFEELNSFVLATNNGSLYVLTNNRDYLVFASEEDILNQFQKKVSLNSIGDYKIFRLEANKGLSIDLEHFELVEFDLSGEFPTKSIYKESTSKAINISIIDATKEQKSVVEELNYLHLLPEADRERALLIYPEDKIKSLKRCTKCLLPTTFPFIRFDNNGVCNYCHNYTKKNQPRPIDDLAKLVEPYRKTNGRPDVLIPLSGGRDSTYVLHVVKEMLDMNIITYTYDWGMVTDLARRNVARICGELGVENVIVAADMHWKRANIRKNIQAWLKNPELGMIPLFMAGDKFFFYYAHQIKKQLGIDLEIWGINYLENTDFKTGFAGLKPEFEKERIYSLSLYNQAKLFGFVGRNFATNWGYLNQSLLDSLGSFASRYITPKANYYHMFDFVHWDEKEIENVILNKYGWETSVDTNSTWRIGDGTASFYNYIYVLVAGFSENDTFRSNQIREGMITREEGLKLVTQENKPRYNSIKWYLNILNLNYSEVIKNINRIKPIY